MRHLLATALLLGLAACGKELRPPAPPLPAGDDLAAGAAAPESAADSVAAIAPRLLRGDATNAELEAARREAEASAAAVIRAAARGEAREQGRAPEVLAALGDEALPALVNALSHRDVRHRRIAAITLLQLATSLQEEIDNTALLSALDAARTDADPAVAAAAKHALRRVTGDTTALDTSRRTMEAAERGR